MRGNEWGNWVAEWGFKPRRRPYGAVAWTGEDLTKSLRKKARRTPSGTEPYFCPGGVDAYLYTSAPQHVRFHSHPQSSLLSPQNPWSIMSVAIQGIGQVTSMSVSHNELHCDGIFSSSLRWGKRIENLGVLDSAPPPSYQPMH
jgi:hypothetical protein